MINRSHDPGIVRDTFEARFGRLGPELGSAGKRVARFILANPAVALASSASALAKRAGTSDATVIRTVQALEYSGLAEMKLALSASLDRAGNVETPADAMRVTLEELQGASLQAVESVLEAFSDTLATLRSASFREQLGRALPILHAAERIALFGIGPSSAIARYAAILLNRSGRRVACLDVSGIMLADRLLDLRKGDAVLAMAYGRPYREVLGLLSHVQELGIPLVLVSDRAEGRPAKLADAVLTVPRGRRRHVALHAGTVLALEIIVLALAASDQNIALTQLDRLNALRAAVLGEQRKV